MAAARILVVVAGDDPLSRAGLSALVAGRDDVAVAGEARTAEAGALARARGADAILWDLGPSGDGGVDGIAAAPAPVVALAASEAQAALAARAGARGVLLRGAEAGTVAAAVLAAARGLAVLDVGLASGWTRPPGAAGAGEGLTAREREVLSLLAEGLGNRAIAARLGISEHTAKFHVNAILAKLGVESRAEAIVRAVRLGLVAL